MKKFISLMLALAFCLTSGIGALAAGTDNFIVQNEYGNFTDVYETEWYYESVKTANEYGLVKGNPDGSFNPDGSLTVAEAIVTADRIHMLYTRGEDTLTNGDPWYQTYVDYALEEKIIKKGDFDDYTRPVTRAEMAYIFSSAVPYEDFEMLNSPENAIAYDINGHKYEEAIKLLYRYGIAVGNDIFGKYTPDTNIKRSEMSALIARVVVPEQRKEVTLLTGFSYSQDILLLHPIGTEPEFFVPEGYDWGTIIDGGDNCTILFRLNDLTQETGWENLLQLPRDEVRKAIDEQMGVQSTAHTLSFGSLPAYRLDYTSARDGKTVEGCFFVFLLDGSLYVIAMAAEYPAGESSEKQHKLLTDMANNMMIAQNKASLAMK